jgi:hypothetical protein
LILPWVVEGIIRLNYMHNLQLVVAKAERLLVFQRTKCKIQQRTYNLGAGIGAQMKMYKNFYIAVESHLQLNSVKTTNVQERIGQLNTTLLQTLIFEKSTTETNDPIQRAMNLSLTPITTIYFTYKF